MGVAEGPDPAQLELERTAGGGAVELRRQVVGAPLLDLAVEGQGQVQLVAGAPLRAGQPGLSPLEGVGHVLGNGQGGEQPDHATVRSG